jgi:hypothetical protein
MTDHIEKVTVKNYYEHLESYNTQALFNGPETGAKIFSVNYGTFQSFSSAVLAQHDDPVIRQMINTVLSDCYGSLDEFLWRINNASSRIIALSYIGAFKSSIVAYQKSLPNPKKKAIITNYYDHLESYNTQSLFNEPETGSKVFSINYCTFQGFSSAVLNQRDNPTIHQMTEIILSDILTSRS